MHCLTGLSALTQAQLDAWVAQAKIYAQTGRVAEYIPRLSQSKADWLAVQIQTVTGQIYRAGEVKHSFSLMSAVKPFALLFLLDRFGLEVFQQVGTEPSDQPFNSLLQLKIDGAWPRNPMINSGALILASLLPGEDGSSRCEVLRQWLNLQADCQLFLDQATLDSVRSLNGEPNQILARVLAQAGRLTTDEAVVLDTYNHICCLSGSVADLARLGLLLAKPGAIASAYRQAVNAIMTTCGLYEASGRYTVSIGLPMKSGVSGALLAVVPGQGAIACYSPALDPAGNSVAGLFLLEQLGQTLELSIFS